MKASSRSILESQTDQSSKGLLSIAASSVRGSRRKSVKKEEESHVDSSVTKELDGSFHGRKT
jgi:hypothetical protein